MSVLGEKIRELRIGAGISQKELAKIIKVSQKTVSSWELGTFEPGATQIILIAKYFNVTFDELLLDDKKD